MSLFSESDQQKLKEQALRETLRKHGLSHLRVKVRPKSRGSDEIIVEGGSEADIKKVSTVLGGATATIKSGKNETQGHVGSIEIDTEPQVEVSPRISRRPKSK